VVGEDGCNNVATKIGDLYALRCAKYIKFYLFIYFFLILK